MIRNKTWRGMTVLAVLAILTWLLARDTGEPQAQPLADLDTRLDYALWNFNAQVLDTEGRVNLEIDAPILRNNASTRIGTVENPRFRILLEEDEWYITADSAIITADREFVSLVGNVDFMRKNRLTLDTLEIRTRDVLLNVTPRTASTDAGVMISQNSDQLEAVGMKLDMKTETYELLDNVQARYANP